VLSWPPLEAFERAADPIMVVDSRGRLRSINAAAAALLECDAKAALGRPCFLVTRMRCRSGEPFCGPTCPVQEQARRGELSSRKRVALSRGDGRRVELDLYSVILRPRCDGRCAVLHLISPESETEPGRLRPDLTSESLDAATARLDLLGHREHEVLRQLACGRSTGKVAEALFISPVTVRNHVRHILTKLHVHTRLEAVLAWTRRFS